MYGIMPEVINRASMNQRRVIGIDVGIADTGWAVVEPLGQVYKTISYGDIHTAANLSMSERLITVFDQLSSIIDEYQPSEAAVESLFYANNQKTVMSVSQSRGVILLAIAKAGIPVFDYTPLQVKSGTTGYGKADKKQVEKMVMLLLKLDKIPKPDDVVDALAICITHLNTNSNLLK